VVSGTGRTPDSGREGEHHDCSQGGSAVDGGVRPDGRRSGGVGRPDTQADASYLHLLDQNGVASPDPEAMVVWAHELVDQLSASPQDDASVASIVNTGEQRVSQHDMGVIIAAAVLAYRPSLVPVVGRWADSAAGFPCGSAAQAVLR